VKKFRTIRKILLWDYLSLGSIVFQKIKKEFENHNKQFKNSILWQKGNYLVVPNSPLM
jgi:hypothetical protein